MNIRIDGTRAEIAHAVRVIRAALPVGSVSPVLATNRPHIWRVFLNTAPQRNRRRWIT